MLTAAYLALCVHVADLSALYLSFEPTGMTLEETTAEAGRLWSEQLRSETGDDAAYLVAMHDGFREAMQLDGNALYQQWGSCLADIDGANAPAPGRKG